MNTRQIEYFIAVAEELNFTKAAARLYVSQTAVTQQIKSLENLIGSPLFIRTKKKVTLTEAGKAFYREAPEILEHIDSVFTHTRDAALGMIGSIDIGFTADIKSTIFPDRILEFHRMYPNIQLHFSSGNPSELLSRLKSRELDIIVTPIFDQTCFVGIAHKTMQRSSLTVVVPFNHKLSHQRSISRQDLQHEKLILACSPDSQVGEDRVIINPFVKAGYDVEILDKIEDIETVLLMVSLHMGVSILPAYIADSNRNDKRVVAIPFENGKEYVDNALAWNPEHSNPTLEQFISFIIDET
ncbi:LysR family transcriptional regulator [Eubacterium oxidoreducens]|uniref:DNA-binding transcriptional regulator, LysR family n=1 Tax=Eubacterium oxidoreducens TaxID=1732 RepID=A0A1G6BVC3_EUBOX|nr:LysR family transcriptional regulator [Eubacterium oxidoreducens]SDB24542.1 DNA-binding transcriptional regulator, LysR family [Eubacterium oxidoreducens]